MINVDETQLISEMCDILMTEDCNYNDVLLLVDKLKRNCGHWNVKYGYNEKKGGYKVAICSRCGSHQDGSLIGANYCPHCGRPMKGV